LLARPADAEAGGPVRIGLARDPARILLWLGIRLVIAEVGLIVGLQTPGAIGMVVTAASLTVLAYVVLITVHALSLHVEIVGGDVHIVSLLVRRRYRLLGGASRMATPRRRGAFGTRVGSYGIELGLGRVEGQTEVEVIRLSPEASVVLIPCREGRLAVAPSSESRLLRALERASSAQGADPSASR
jgi:hypothetical protein